MEQTPYKLSEGQVAQQMTAEQLREGNTLHVSMVPVEMEEEELAELFGRYGEVRGLSLTRQSENEDSQSDGGVAHVTYAKRAEALEAVAALRGIVGLPPSLQPLVVKLALESEAEAETEAEAEIETDASIAKKSQSAPDCPSPSLTPPPPPIEPPQPPQPPPPLSQMQQQMLQHQQMQHQQHQQMLQHQQQQMHPQMQMGMHPMMAMGQAPGMPGMGMPGMGMMGGMGGGQMMGMHPYGMQMAGHGHGAGYGAAGGSGHSTAGHKLFVGMIPYATGEGELQSAFSQFGPLMEVFMMREKDGRSKGCAFIRYFDRRAADAACATLHGSMALPGAARALVVKYADPSEPRTTNSRSSSAASQSPTLLGQSVTASPMSSPPMMQGMQGMQMQGVQGMQMQGMQAGEWQQGGEWQQMQGADWQQMQQMGMMGLPPNMAGAMMAPGSPMGSPMGMGHPQMWPLAAHHMGGAHMPPFAMPPPASQHADATPPPPPGAPPPGAEATWAPPPPPHAAASRMAEMAETAEEEMAAMSLNEYGTQQVPGGGERLFVSNLPKHVAEQELLHIFGPFGQVTELQLLRRADGSSKGSAFVAFESAAESAAACSMLARYVLPGAARPMTIKSSTQKRANKSRGGYGARSEPIFGKSFDREIGTSVVAGDLHDLGSQQITNFVNPASPSSGSSSGDGVAGGDGEGLLASVTAGEVPSKDRPVAAPAKAASAWA